MHLVKKFLPAFNIKSFALHSLVWGALIGLPILIPHRPPTGQGLGVAVLSHYFFTITNILHAALFYLNAFWVQPKLFNEGKKWQYTLAVSILVGAIFYLKILLIQIGFFSFSLEPYLLPILFFPTVLFVLISIVYRMVIDKINFENEQLKMELKFLRSQVSPHFLFNVLNNMVSMARKKSDQLESSLIKLSGLMRYMLHESGGLQVSLDKEIEYLKSYIELQEIRFSHDVPVRVNLPEGDSSHKIEPMLLIPFVENAFKHGVGLIDEPKIHISLSIEDGHLLFRVKNKFNQQDNQKDSRSGIGLKNVKKRLDILYPDKHQLDISHTDNIFNVHLKITLQ